jgi:putative flippase GtrA
MSKIKNLIDKYFDYSMLRWGTVGLSTTVIDYLIFISLYTRSNSVFASNLVAGVVATTINYTSHYRWSFKSDSQHTNSGFKYLINWMLWWVVGTSIIKILIELNVNARIAKLLPLLVIAPLSFLLLKKFVFVKNPKNPWN